MNLCLLAANYAPAHLGYDDGPVSTMLEAMLSQHDPAPAFVFDASWTMRRLNRGGSGLCSIVLPRRVGRRLETRDRDRHARRATDIPKASCRRCATPDAVGAGFLQQLRLEQLTNPSLGNRVDQFERSLRERFHPPEDDRAHDPSESGLTLEFRHSARRNVDSSPHRVSSGCRSTSRSARCAALWFPADADTRDNRSMRTSRRWTTSRKRRRVLIESDQQRHPRRSRRRRNRHDPAISPLRVGIGGRCYRMGRTKGQCTLCCSCQVADVGYEALRPNRREGGEKHPIRRTPVVTLDVQRKTGPVTEEESFRHDDDGRSP